LTTGTERSIRHERYDMRDRPGEESVPGARRRSPRQARGEDAAATRSGPVKNVAQQAALALHRARQGFIKARTAQANQIRGLLAELGLIIPQGIKQLSRRVPELTEDATNELPGTFRLLVQRLPEKLQHLDSRSPRVSWSRPTSIPFPPTTAVHPMSKRLDYTQIAPAGVKALGGVYGYVMQSGLSPVLVDLVYLRVSQINNCAYCLDMHTRDLLKKGQKVEKLALLQAWAEAGHLFDERERAALAWAETVTRVAESGVPDAAYEAARAVFNERELVDLTVAISLMNAYNRMAISFRNTPQAALAQ
jgi:AhpD family alkylhydroperoxidase